MENKNYYIIAGVAAVAILAVYSAKKKTPQKNEIAAISMQSESESVSPVVRKQSSQAPRQQGIVESASLNLKARADQDAAQNARNVSNFEARVCAEYKQIVNKQFTKQEFNDLSNKVISQKYRYPEDLMAAYLDLRNKIILSSTNRVAQDEMLSTLDQKYGAKAEKMEKLQYKGYGIDSKGDRLVLKMNR